MNGIRGRVRYVLAMVFAGALLLPGRVVAQATRADSAAVILGTAERFREQGRDDVATALYEYLVGRFGDTAAAARARELLGSRPGGGSTRGGRVELQVWSTLYGLWLGVAVPAMFGADGPKPYGIGLLLGGPFGFLTGAGLARSRELTDAQARAITFGGTWGTWQGYGWAEVLDWGEFDYSTCDPLGCQGEDKSSERRFAGMVLGGVAGIATGALLSRRDLAPGDVALVNLGALWGTWFGLAGGVLAGAHDDKLLATTLLAGDAGILSMALLAPGWNMSRNRARLISIAGVVGGLAGAGVDLIAQPDDEKTGIAIPLVMSVAGLAIGAATTRNYDARAVSDGGPAAALVQFGHGRVSLGVPMPVALLAPVVRHGRLTHEVAAGITLLKARF